MDKVELALSEGFGDLSSGLGDSGRPGEGRASIWAFMSSAVVTISAGDVMMVPSLVCLGVDGFSSDLMISSSQDLRAR